MSKINDNHKDTKGTKKGLKITSRTLYPVISDYLKNTESLPQWIDRVDDTKFRMCPNVNDLWTGESPPRWTEVFFVDGDITIGSNDIDDAYEIWIGLLHLIIKVTFTVVALGSEHPE
jgi:hypothetical protein